MRVGINLINFGPGVSPESLARTAELGEALGFDLLMVSDHVAVTPDVACEQYPAPFYEPFTTLAWLAGITSQVRLGTTVLIVPYRHPLLAFARMAANLNQLSGGRLGLGRRRRRGPAGVRRPRRTVRGARPASPTSTSARSGRPGPTTATTAPGLFFFFFF